MPPCEPDRVFFSTAAPQRLERRENDRVWSLLLARRETDKPPNCASSTPSSAFVGLEVRVAGGEEDDNLRCTPIAPDAAGLTVWVGKKDSRLFKKCVQAITALTLPRLNRAKQR